MNRLYKGMISYMLVLCMFTGYLLLDTFAISRVYGDAESPAETATETEASQQTGVTASNETSYKDDNIAVSLSTYRAYDTNVYVADVTVSDPSYLKTALAGGMYGKNVKDETSSIAESVDAILAINGDYYGVRERGYVIKNGTLYRNTSAGDQEDLVIYADGSFGIINESEVTAEELLADGVVQTLSFGPALVVDGEIAVSRGQEVTGRSMESNPRTAIGIIDDCHYVLMVSDGRTESDAGLDLHEMAEFMSELGVKTAYNLDGGGSSTMYFNGEIVNNPTGGRAGHGSGSERSVSDIVYIGY